MLNVCQCICLWLSYQERVSSLIVITTYAECLSMYHFMVLPSRKGFQSDCNYHIYAQYLSMYLFMALLSRKGLQSDCYYHICLMFVNVSVYGSPIKKGFTV